MCKSAFLPAILVFYTPRHGFANLVERLLCHEPAQHHDMQHCMMSAAIAVGIADATKPNCVHSRWLLATKPTMNLIRFPTPTVSPTAMAPPLGSMPMIPLMRKSFASSCDSSLKSSGATATVRLLLTSSLHTNRWTKLLCMLLDKTK